MAVPLVDEALTRQSAAMLVASILSVLQPKRLKPIRATLVSVANEEKRRMGTYEIDSWKNINRKKSCHVSVRELILLGIRKKQKGRCVC